MSKLWLIGVAASAAWTQAAAAHDAPPAPTPPPMGHGAHAPMPGPGAPMMRHRMNPGPGRHKNMHRIGRGFMLPPTFMGPQFIVHDWRMFGFPAPMPGGRWVRYYDDALMIDRDGRVVDGRYGWDWDRRGGRDHDDGPYDDRYADDRDHDRDEDWRDRDGDRGRVVNVLVRRDGKKGDCRRSCAPVRHIPPPPPQHHGYGYGYGCGCGPVVITETITTTAPVVEKHIYYETVRTHRAAPRRHHARPVVRHAKPVVRYAKPVRRAPARPRPGERG